MKKISVSILGVGQMGLNFVQTLSTYDWLSVSIYDIDTDKANNISGLYNVINLKNFSDALNSDILILALPKDGVLNFLGSYYNKMPPSSICINLCTFLSLEDITQFLNLQKVKLGNNIMSCKLIAHFKKTKVLNTKWQIICSSICKDNNYYEYALCLLGYMGRIILDNESKYMDLNLIVAAEAMKNILSLKKKLFSEGYDEQTIDAAIKFVYIGTSEQYPYSTIDYFLKQVCEAYPDITALLS